MKHAALFAALVAACVMAVAGCGDSNDSATAPKPATAAAKAAAPAAAPGAIADGVLSGAVYEWGIIAGATRAKAGTLKFRFHNLAAAEHEVVVIQTDKKADDLGSGAKVPEAGTLGEIEGIRPNASGELTLKLEPGHYALICNLSGHYAQGMYADLEVVA